MLTLKSGGSQLWDKVFKVLRPLTNCLLKDRKLVIKCFYLDISYNTLFEPGEQTNRQLSRYLSISQRSTRPGRLLLVCWSILCQLFAQNWTNLRWGRFNNVEVDLIILFKLRTIALIYAVFEKIFRNAIKYCSCKLKMLVEYLFVFLLAAQVNIPPPRKNSNRANSNKNNNNKNYESHRNYENSNNNNNNNYNNNNNQGDATSDDEDDDVSPTSQGKLPGWQIK